MLQKEIKLIGFHGDHEKRINTLEKLSKKMAKWIQDLHPDEFKSVFEKETQSMLGTIVSLEDKVTEM